MKETPFISVYLKAGTIYVYQTALHELGMPPFIRFRMHSSGNLMLIESFDKKTQTSFKVPRDLHYHGHSMRVYSKRFCYAIAQCRNLDINKSYRFSGYSSPDNSAIIFDLAGAEQITQSNSEI